MINRYSLADHIVRIDFGGDLGTIEIGGTGNNHEGSFVGEIRISRNTDMWTTEGDPTGSWVHNKNLDRTGKVDVQVRQVAESVGDFIRCCQWFESRNGDGATITVTANGETVATARDCYISKIPDQVFGSTAEMQSWSFTAGQVRFRGEK